MTLAEFRAIFPEFAATPDARVQLWLNLANSRVTEPVWGDQQALGQALFTAHYLATGGVAAGGGSTVAAGEVTAKKVGEVQVSYSATSNRDESAGWWNSSVYGRQYWSLFRTMGVGVTQLI